MPNETILLNTLEERHQSCATWAHKKYKHQTTRRCKESQKQWFCLKRTTKSLLVQSASVCAQPPIPNDTFNTLGVQFPGRRSFTREVFVKDK